MLDETAVQRAADLSEIQNLISKSIISRDSGMWEELAQCYHSDATLTSSWFSGSPSEFVAAAQEMKIARHAGETQKHVVANNWIETNGKRAVSESDLILFQRRQIEGIEFDFTTWSRRIHLFEQRDGNWKIWKRMSVYEKDRMDPVDPSSVPNGFYKSLDLSKYPQQIRFHCWRNEIIGYPPTENICVKGGDREREVRETARKWIA